VQPYVTLVFIVVFIIPALIIVLCYAIIVGVIWRKSTLTTVARPTTMRSTNELAPMDTTAATQMDDCSTRRRHLYKFNSQQPNQRFSATTASAGNHRLLMRFGECIRYVAGAIMTRSDVFISVCGR
jgi:hypothetical protein